jgi:phospholipid/cholesterol/gamma-HCH transport system permease protein
MPETSETSSLSSFLGDIVKQFVFSVQDYALLSLQSVTNLFSPPQYWMDTVDQMDLIGVGSLPIIIAAALSIGGVMVLNTASEFQRFASELGSMVVTEQVDAMRALGTDPIRKLMTPRVVAVVLTVPILVAIFDLVGLCGGFVVAWFTLRLGAVQFWTTAIHSLTFGDLVQGFVKPVVFAFIIATVGCYQGLRVTGGTQGVGRATTTAVVISSVMVLVSDLFLAKLLLYLFK